jgi:hypothetical protein
MSLLFNEPATADPRLMDETQTSNLKRLFIVFNGHVLKT